MANLESYGKAKNWLVSKWDGIFHKCPPSKWKRGGRYPFTTVPVAYDIRKGKIIAVICTRCGRKRNIALFPGELDLQNKILNEIR